MSGDEKLQNMILDSLKDLTVGQQKTFDCISGLDKKVDLNIQETKHHLENIRKTDEEQNRILDEHIAGVNAVKALVESHKVEWDNRLKKVEEPRKALILLVKIASGFTVIAAAAGIIYGWFFAE